MKIYEEYAPIVLRISISLVFIWFGFSQIFNPNLLTGYLPAFAYSLGIKPLTLIFLNGIFESFFGLMLLIGFKTRLSSFLLGVHLFVITMSLGFNEIGVRDFGLTASTFAIFLNGADKWSLDGKLKGNN
jgi:uncharacterized membrane protein YphA (DoxX/SURF4 family)